MALWLKELRNKYLFLRLVRHTTYQVRHRALLCLVSIGDAPRFWDFAAFLRSQKDNSVAAKFGHNPVTLLVFRLLIMACWVGVLLNSTAISSRDELIVLELVTCSSVIWVMVNWIGYTGKKYLNIGWCLVYLSWVRFEDRSLVWILELLLVGLEDFSEQGGATNPTICFPRCDCSMPGTDQGSGYVILLNYYY